MCTCMQAAVKRRATKGKGVCDRFPFLYERYPTPDPPSLNHKAREGLASL